MQFGFVYIHLKHSCKGHHLLNSTASVTSTGIPFSVPNTQPVSNSKALRCLSLGFYISFSIPPLLATHTSLHHTPVIFSDKLGWNKCLSWLPILTHYFFTLPNLPAVVILHCNFNSLVVSIICFVFIKYSKSRSSTLRTFQVPPQKN